MHTIISTGAVVALFTSLAVPAQGGLLFTGLNKLGPHEKTLATKPSSLRVIDREDVAVVTPETRGAYSARKFAPRDAFTTLVGDENNDGSIWEVLTRNTDALLWKGDITGRSMRNLYISTNKILGDHVNASTGGAGLTATARPADVFRVVIDSATGDGQFYFLLREEQIRDAFKIDDKESLNVDAVTVVSKDDGIIYLSFERDHMVSVSNSALPLVAHDGSIVGLRVETWDEPVVLATDPALMVATEAEINAMVAASGIHNRSDLAAITIGDLDGLHGSKKPGNYQCHWGTFPHLMFCGEHLTGCGIVNTGGVIEVINGVLMGSTTTASDGSHVGLLPGPAPNAESLNGLHVRSTAEIGKFVTETPFPSIHGGGILRIDIEGTAPGPAVLLVDMGLMPIHPFSAAMAPLTPNYFPETIWVSTAYVSLTLGPNSIGSYIDAAPAVDLRLVFQAVQFDGGNLVLSTPCTVELYAK